MNFLSVENLSKYYGDKLLFEEISFGIDKGQKVALIARNGTGKTTLLNIINGKDTADSGTLTLRNNIRIGYLPQVFDSQERISVLDAVFETDTPVTHIIKEYETALELFNRQPTQENRLRMDNAVEGMDNLQAWDFESKAKEILTRFDIQDILKDMRELSGGQRKKVALVKMLLSDADFLIMDEPTNHLDIEMIEWMESYFLASGVTLLMVTHDRFFLDKVCTEILELENGKLYRYKGKYDYYLEKKEERIANTAAETEKAKSIYRSELEWMRSTPQARTTKAKARADNFRNIKEKAFTRIDRPDKTFAVKTERIGNKILEINNLHFSFDNHIIIDDFSYIFKRGERCGIVGKNGSGKTTLLRLIMQELKPNAGKITSGETVIFGYYSQDGLSSQNRGKRVIDIVKEQAEMVRMASGNYLSASQFLNHFGFAYEHQYTYFENLSGGQRRKLHLLIVLLQNPNFLILDEPTNDFDIETLTILEDFLRHFSGCLLIVSHDRWFLDKLVDHMFIIRDNGKIKDFYGNYTAYKLQLQEEERIKRLQQKSDKPVLRQETQKNNNKQSYKRQKELELSEKEIARLEQEKAVLLELLNTGKGTHEELVAWSEQYAAIDTELEAKVSQWINLLDETESAN
ncbi:MAG: ABC-F family ATP-binding cassette domain-containing protein [Bacteroidales bacterium]|jgi:ATP-binding cassette subfamily F protein uup|nr:ABC-F family ATP-binding cassette domain-containing protein [Bacteroidales bacterium]